ncbi:MAG: DUF503 domain-containing protein [Anaerolineales bacterium]
MLTIHLRIPGCASLKEKRSQIKPLLARLHREFNISVAEIDYQDTWQNALIGITLVSNDGKHTERTLQKVVTWIEKHHPHLFIVEEHIELI